MEKNTGRFPQFYALVTASSLKTDCLHIPSKFASQYMSAVSSDVVIVCGNGDNFRLKFCREKRCFVGVKTIVTRYQLSRFSFLIFQYMGSSDFGLMVFANYGVEIEYPKPHVSVEFEMPTDFEVIAVDEANKLSSGWSVSAELNTNCIRHSTTSMPHKIFEVPVIDNISVEQGLFICSSKDPISRQFQHGEEITFGVHKSKWSVRVVCENGGWFLKDGCSNFAAQIGIECGDLFSFEWSNKKNCYEAAIFKKYHKIGSNIRRGRGHRRPKSFVVVVLKQLLNKFEIVVPVAFVRKYEADLPTNLFLQFANSDLKFRATYDSRSHKICGLADMCHTLKLELTDLLVFKYQLNGNFQFSLFSM